jgi:hypothetical protein
MPGLVQNSPRTGRLDREPEAKPQVALPDALAVGADYGLTIITGASPLRSVADTQNDGSLRHVVYLGEREDKPAIMRRRVQQEQWRREEDARAVSGGSIG